MAKRRKRGLAASVVAAENARARSFEQRVHDEINASVAPPDDPPPKHPGWARRGRIWDGQRYYSQVRDDVPPADVPTLLAQADEIVVDDCGCMGGCSLEWVDRSTRRRIAAAGRISWSPRVEGEVLEWLSEDGRRLVYLCGPVNLP